MQKTLTIRGVRYTAANIDALMSTDNMTNGDDYIVVLNGDKYYANYRQIQEPPFAPTCVRHEAEAIALMPDDGMFRWSIWLEFDPRRNQAAVILGSTKSERKAASSAVNGRLGGRPRRRYWNQSELYGDQVKATIADYRELNPDGDFVETVTNGQDVILDRSTGEVVATASKAV